MASFSSSKELAGRKHARNSSPASEERPAKQARTGKGGNDFDDELETFFDIDDDDTVRTKRKSIWKPAKLMLT
jgi:hypothetical protein